MSGTQRRPSIITKRTHVRAKKHASDLHAKMPTAPRVFDRIVVSLGFAGFGLYIYKNYYKMTPYEIVGLSLGTISIAHGLYDLGKRTGLVEGASFVLLGGAEGVRTAREEDDWRGEFKGKEYEDLKTAEKIAWLRKEEKRIRDAQSDEQFRCGQAYIAKEEAYAAYERHGGYGGEDWRT
jgi:hypothetical protein